jgi:hypothetical protein|nr:hypothetical protein [uncultured Mediterranean phage uvMED]
MKHPKMKKPMAKKKAKKAKKVKKTKKMMY